MVKCQIAAKVIECGDDSLDIVLRFNSQPFLLHTPVVFLFFVDLSPSFSFFHSPSIFSFYF